MLKLRRLKGDFILYCPSTHLSPNSSDRAGKEKAFLSTEDESHELSTAQRRKTSLLVLPKETSLVFPKKTDMLRTHWTALEDVLLPFSPEQIHHSTKILLGHNRMGKSPCLCRSALWISVLNISSSIANIPLSASVSLFHLLCIRASIWLSAT